MPRFAGDYQGRCTACQEDVELALGIATDREPVAMHFGPGGPQDVAVSRVELVSMIENQLDMKFAYACPLCGEWSAARVTCQGVPSPADTPGD